MSLSFPIERGLFQFSESADHHAVLGLPLDADNNQIRKRYLQITRSLHPDSHRIQDKAQKKLASTILSKLVNPAYEQLYKDKSRRSEYKLVLSQVGKRLATEGGSITLHNEAAKKLVNSGANLESLYRQEVKALAAQQYQSLEEIVNKIADLSELNCVYLMRTQGQKLKQSAKATTTSGQTAIRRKQATNSPQQPEPPVETSLPTDSYIRRAKSYMEKNHFDKALLELRDALKIDPNNAHSHALLGGAYLKQGKQGMARVHIRKALQLSPNESITLQVKQAYEKLTHEKITLDSPPEPTKVKSGGLLNNLFSKKK